MRTILAFLLLTTPAFAAPCVSIEEDRTKIEATPGWTWLGVEPARFTRDGFVVYYEFQGKTYISPVFDGCVGGTAYLLGKYLAEIDV